MTARRLTGCTLTAGLLAAAAPFAAAGPYSLAPASTGEPGTQGSSTNYTAVLTVGQGRSGSSLNYTARTGFVAQLPDPVQLELSAPAAAVDEGGTLQLAAAELFDDATRALLSRTAVTWSASSGPVSGISAAGLLTAGNVYTDSPAVVAASAGVTGTLPLTVRNILPDNFGTYAADGLPDSWQVQYFGIGSPNAAQHDDHDSDSVDNLIEFAFGTNPASGSSGLQNLVFSRTLAGGGTLGQQGLPITLVEAAPNGVDFRVLFIRRADHAAVGLTYTPQFSADLSTWLNGNTPVSVLAQDGTYQVASVRFPLFLQGRKVRFFRLSVSLEP